MKYLRALASSSAFLVASLPCAAQTITPLVMQGDVIPNVGPVTVIDNLAVNNAGDWMVECRTNSTSNAVNQVTIKNGVVVWREGQNMTSPSGTTLKKFDSLTIDAAGNSATNLELLPAAAGLDSGIYWNDRLVIQEGDTSGALGFGTGTVYTKFLEARINDVNQMLIIAEMDDPTVATGNERAIILLDLDASGNLLGETLVQNVGTNLTGTIMSASINDFGVNPHYYSFNDAGDALYHVILNTGQGGSDEALVMNSAILIEESAPSVVAGRNWDSMSTATVALNNVGDVAFATKLDGLATSDKIIVLNNNKFMQEGDLLPGALSSWNVVNFGTGPLEIGDNGNLLWFCRWNDLNTSQDTGLFINNAPIVEEGVTLVGSNLVTGIAGTIDGYHISPNGDFVIFEGTLDTGLSGAFLVTLGNPGGGGQPGTTFCFGDGSGATCPCGNFGATGTGCVNSSGAGGRLSATGSASLQTSDAAFQADSLPPSRIAMLAAGNSSSSNLWGDGLLCIGSPWGGLTARMTSANGTAAWDSSVLAGGGFAAGQTSFFQVLFRDPQSGPCGSGFGSTGAYQITFTP